MQPAKSKTRVFHQVPPVRGVGTAAHVNVCRIGATWVDVAIAFVRVSAHQALAVELDVRELRPQYLTVRLHHFRHSSHQRSHCRVRVADAVHKVPGMRLGRVSNQLVRHLFRGLRAELSVHCFPNLRALRRGKEVAHDGVAERSQLIDIYQHHAQGQVAVGAGQLARARVEPQRVLLLKALARYSPGAIVSAAAVLAALPGSLGTQC